jgi:predicted nucleic acid-binding protein
MRLVVADTSPVFYLLSIDHVGLLPQLFGKIFVPDAVRKSFAILRLRLWFVNGRHGFLHG